MRKLINVILMMLVAVTMTVSAQDAKKPMVEKESPYAADHKTIDSTIAALYAVISGEKGQKRDWDRFRALFHPDGRLIPSGANGAKAFTPNEYIERSEPFMMQQGFFEREISRTQDVYGSIAQIFSTYDAVKSKSDKEPFLRGINSIQLLYDGKRWWVMSVFWRAESKDLPLPSKYLKAKN